MVRRQIKLRVLSDRDYIRTSGCGLIDAMMYLSLNE